jgi:hypothetical protein
VATGIRATRDRLFVSAYYAGVVDLGGGRLDSTRDTAAEGSSTDATLLSYDATTHQLRWAQHFGTPQFDSTSHVAMRGENPVFAMFPQGAFEVGAVLIEPRSEATSVLLRVAE